MENNKYKPTEAIKQNALIGKVLKTKYQRENAENLLFSYSDLIEKADKVLSEKDITLSEVKSLYFRLLQLEKGYNNSFVKEDGGPNDSTIGFLLCGGGAAIAWCEGILKQQEIIKNLDNSKYKDEKDKSWFSNISVEKSVNTELKQATYIVLEPDVVDLHGDTYDEETVRKACHNFNCSSTVSPNLFHITTTETFSIVESYITPVEFILDNQVIKKGTWLCVLQYHDDLLWQAAKDGEIQGVSIGALATVEILDKGE